MKRVATLLGILLIAGGASASVLISPGEDARFGRWDDIPAFTWNDVAQSGESYWIEFSLDPDFETDVARIQVDGTVFDLGKYVSTDDWMHLAFRAFWRVAWESSISQARMFTKTPIVPPRVHFPFDARHGPGDPAPRIEWEAVFGSTGYRMEFAFDPEFSEGYRVDIESTWIDLAQEIPADDWIGSSFLIYFRVWAMDPIGLDGPYYQVFRLSKSSLPPPPVGQPSGDYFSARTDLPVFIWQAYHGFKGYQVQIARDGRWDRDPLEYETTGNHLDLSDVMAREEWEMMWGYHAWRVSAVEASGAVTPWSDDTEFYKCGGKVLTALGDSITTGGVCVPESWVDGFQYLLEQSAGDVVMFNASVGGTKSKWGAEVIGAVLQYTLPEFILLLFGANDSVDPGNCDPPYGCDVAGHLWDMVFIAREFGTIPIISTVLPVNPEGAHYYHQFRVDMYNDEIRYMASQNNVHLIDLNEAMWAHGNIPELFCDWGHPNETGNALIAHGYYSAVSEYWW